ncbi:MAG: ASKHA domain-containing protein [Phycisphaerae bacterium]
MAQKQLRVTFQPHGRAVYVLPGTTVLEAAARAALTIDTPCGGAGTCGKCRVRFTSGACPPTDAEKQHISERDLDAGWRLACQTHICGESVVTVPESSIFADQHQILTESLAAAEAEILPAVRKQYVELPQPSLDDARPDLVRLDAELGHVNAGLDLLRVLPGRLREGGFKGTAVLTDGELIDFEPGDTSSECVGVAFDVGTTTIAAAMLDLTNGEELAVASGVNPQVSYGDDVLTRIRRAGESSEGGGELRCAVVEGMDALLERLCSDAGVSRQRIYELTVAGNTTMEHLLCGLPVGQLGEVPFVPVHGRALTLNADELGLDVHPRAPVHMMPLIGGFVGGDVVAGMLATRLCESQSPTMLIDVGTNGEIVLVHDGRLWAASTAAGPAFEGARISCGMRASAGAVEKVVFEGDRLHCGVIANAEPVGLCGSGLIDAAAVLLNTGAVTSNGRLLPPDDLPETVPDDIRGRIRSGSDGGTEFFLCQGREKPVLLMQRDIRELQLASGAIRAGTMALLARAHLEPTDLGMVMIAGGFGSYIRRENAMRIGLLPCELAPETVHFVGNASLCGARWALLSTAARKRAEKVARQTEHVELSRDDNFQMLFAESMIFPEMA